MPRATTKEDLINNAKENYEKLNRKFDMNVLILKKGENYGKK